MSESDQNKDRQKQHREQEQEQEQEQKEQAQQKEEGLSVSASSPQENLDNQQTTQLDDNQEQSPDQKDEDKIDPEKAKQRLKDAMSKKDQDNQENEEIENEDALLFTAEMLALLFKRTKKTDELMQKGGEHSAEESRSNDFKNHLKEQIKHMEGLDDKSKKSLLSFCEEELPKDKTAKEEFDRDFLPRYQNLKQNGNMSPKAEAELDKTVKAEYAKHEAHSIQQRAKLIANQLQDEYGNNFKDRNWKGRKHQKEDARIAMEDLNSFAGNLWAGNTKLSDKIDSNDPEGSLKKIQQEFEDKINNVQSHGLTDELQNSIQDQKEIFQDMHKYNQQKLKSIVPEAPKPANNQERQPPYQNPNNQVNGNTAGRYQPNVMDSNQLPSQAEEVLRVTDNNIKIPQGKASPVDFSGPNNPGQVYYIEPVQDSRDEFSIKKQGGAKEVDDENLINTVKSMPGDEKNVTSINQELQDQHDFLNKAENQGVSIHSNVEKQIQENKGEEASLGNKSPS